MRKNLVLLGVLMLLSVGMAYTVSASDALRRELSLRSIRIEIKEAEFNTLIPISLSPSETEKAITIALRNPQVQEMLGSTDSTKELTIRRVYHVFDLQEIEGNECRKVAIVAKEGFAVVQLGIKETDGGEVRIKMVKVTSELLSEEVTAIEKLPDKIDDESTG